VGGEGADLCGDVTEINYSHRVINPAVDGSFDIDFITLCTEKSHLESFQCCQLLKSVILTENKFGRVCPLITHCSRRKGNLRVGEYSAKMFIGRLNVAEFQI
jgi:hypothetical protein